MQTSWYTILWRQFGAAIDMLDSALVACPASLWKEPVWHDPSDLPPELTQFWYIAYHTLFWLDLYLSGNQKEAFVPPAPFTLAELDPAGVPPDRIYTREELHAYLLATRQKCHVLLSTLTDEQADRIVAYPWAQERTISFLELQLYNMRHVQEHAAQLSLFLGQRAVPITFTWVKQASEA